MRAEHEGDPTAAIEYRHNAYCVCGYDPSGPWVRVVNIAQGKTGWVAQGEIHHGDRFCGTCGSVYRQLVDYVPIECATFPCPTCGPGSQLTTEILSISEADGGYNFVAQLKCNACSKPHLLSKLLRGLSRITKVKVGPTGVEVEVKS